MVRFDLLYRCVQLVLVGTSLILFTGGCAPATKQYLVLDERQPRVVIVGTEDDDKTDSEPGADSSSFLLPFAAMINEAQIYCNEGRYGSADSLLREVIALLSGDNGQFFQDSTIPVDMYMKDVVFTYGELMADSIPIPDEIAHLVFQHQMLLSLDSIEFSSTDSAVVAALVDKSGEAFNVPIVWNDRVQRALHYYLTRNKSTVDRWRERCDLYLPFIKKMFVDSSLPSDLAYLPLIESGFNAKAYSRAHASGIWQFIPSTGKLYGMRANYWIDERRDPVCATGAAIRYLRKLYGDFNHWHLALAAYNCGEGGLSRAIKKYRTDDYWKLRLPSETMNYVPLYLAALTIAKKNGFAGAIQSDTIPFDTVNVSDCVDLRDIAEGIGAPHDTIKKLNPHILRWCTPPDMSGVRIYLPSGSAARFKEFYTALPDDKKVKWYRYKVRSGDNLGSIARHFRLPVEGIKSVNKIHGSRIIAGKYLFIPIPVGSAAYSALPDEREPPASSVATSPVADVPADAKLTVYEVRPGDCVWRLAELFNVRSEQICGWNNLVGSQIKVGQILSIYTVGEQEVPAEKIAATNNGNSAGTGQYTVKPGDNAFRIAQRFSMTLKELCSLNGLDPDRAVVRPGDRLHVTGTIPDAVASSSNRNTKSAATIPPGALVYVVATGDNLYRIAQNFSVGIDQIRRMNNLSQSATIRAGDTLFIPQDAAGKEKIPSGTIEEVVYYTVKNGDNLWRIAHDFGISVDRLTKLNNLESSSVLMPGDTIRVQIEGEM